MHEALLGFDARVVGPQLEALWAPERRDEFLLREVTLPLSVDTLVWPSAFCRDPASVPSHLGAFAWVQRPDWIGANDLWDDLASMEAALAAVPATADGRQVWKIAVTRNGLEALKPGIGGPFLEPTSPQKRQPGWELLGYDVADAPTK